MISKLVLPPGAFRLLLAAAVLVSHLSRWNFGVLAVLLFFFLSGYWVSRIWTDKFAGNEIGRFYASRYFRIIPLYLIVMLAAAWATGAAVQPKHLALLGLDTFRGDIIGVAWSLDIELQFYIVLPLLMMVGLGAPRWVNAAIIMLVAVAGWFVAERFGIRTVAQYLPAFALGVFTQTASWDPGRRAAFISAGAFVAFTAILALIPGSGVFQNVDPATRMIDFHIVCFFWMLPLVPYVAHSLGQPSDQVDRHLGNLSYPLYLVHFPTIMLIKAQMEMTPVAKLAAIAISIVLSLALYFLIDRPVDRLRVKLFERRAAPKPSQAQA